MSKVSVSEDTLTFSNNVETPWKIFFSKITEMSLMMIDDKNLVGKKFYFILLFFDPKTEIK